MRRGDDVASCEIGKAAWISRNGEGWRADSKGVARLRLSIPRRGMAGASWVHAPEVTRSAAAAPRRSIARRVRPHPAPRRARKRAAANAEAR